MPPRLTIQSPGNQAQARVALATFSSLVQRFKGFVRNHPNGSHFRFTNEYMTTYVVALSSIILIYDGKQHQYDFEFMCPEAPYFSAGGSSTINGFAERA